MTSVGPVPPIGPMQPNEDRPPKSAEQLKEEQAQREEARKKLKKTLDEGEHPTQKSDDDIDWEKGVLA